MLHVGAAKISVQSDSMAGQTEHGFNELNLRAVKRESSSGAETHSTVASGSTINFRRTWSSDQSELATLIWGCSGAECTRDPLSTFLSRASISNGCMHRTIAHKFCFLSTNDFTINNRSRRSRRSQHHGDERGGFVVTTNPKDTVKDGRDEVGLCPLLQAQEITSRPPKEHEGHGADTAFETCVSALHM